MSYVRVIYEKIIYRFYSLFYKNRLLKLSIFIKYFLSKPLFFLFKNKYQYISKLLKSEEFDQEFTLNNKFLIPFNQIYKKNNAQLIFFSKVLSIGPASNYEEEVMKFNPDLIVLTKINLESINNNIPHLFVLNDTWSRKNISLIEEVANKKKNSFIYTPSGINQTYKYPSFMSLFNSSNLGISPMGLQRLLLILPNLVKFNSLILRGYNFGITENPYLSWYPSLIKENWGSIKRGLFLSYMRHSLPYNINLTRQILAYFYQEKNIKLDCNDLLKILKKPIYEIIEEFKLKIL